MGDERERFVGSALPVISAASYRSTGSGPIIILVIDDSSDADFADVIAAAAGSASDAFTATWTALVDEAGTAVRFHLLRVQTGAERRWLVTDPPADFVEVLRTDPHLVALLPERLAGDPDSPLEPEHLHEAMFVTARTASAG